MQIKAAISDDAAVIARLNQSIHELHCRLAPEHYQSAPRESIIAEFASMLAESDTQALIAWENDTPIGCCVLKIVERAPNPWACGYRRLLVDQISVEPPWRRQGIGTRLMERAFQFARQHGISEVVLEYWATNEAARQFYKALNFAPRMEKVLLTIADDT